MVTGQAGTRLGIRQRDTTKRDTARNVSGVTERNAAERKDLHGSTYARRLKCGASRGTMEEGGGGGSPSHSTARPTLRARDDTNLTYRAETRLGRSRKAWKRGKRREGRAPWHHNTFPPCVHAPLRVYRLPRACAPPNTGCFRTTGKNLSLFNLSRVSGGSINACQMLVGFHLHYCHFYRPRRDTKLA